MTSLISKSLPGLHFVQLENAIAAKFRTAKSRTAFWYRRSLQRRALAELPQHRLEDIGVSPMAAQAESGKFFWLD